MRVFVYLFLVFTLVSNNISLTSAKVISPKASQANKNFVSIKSKEILISNDFLRFTYKAPILQGLKNTDIQSDINAGFEKVIMDFRNSLEAQAIKDEEEAKNAGRVFTPFEGHVDYKVTFNKNNIISIPMTFYSYTGGAHGFTLQKPYNINTKTGKQIDLNDIFKEGTNYKDIINKEIERQVKENPSIYFPNVLRLIYKIGDNRSFYITKDSIVIYYGLYEIAPYAAGIREFKIPFSLFRNGVKSEFFKK